MAGILAQFLFLIDREITKLYKGLPNCEWNIDIMQVKVSIKKGTMRKGVLCY